MASTAVLILFAAALWFTMLPLFRTEGPWIEPEGAVESELAALEQEKTIYLKALKDIQFEEASGKINSEDYEELRAHYRQKVSEVMNSIEDLDSEEVAGSSDNG